MFRNKILAIFLASILIITIAACTSEGSRPEENTADSTPAQQSEPNGQEAPSPTDGKQIEITAMVQYTDDQQRSQFDYAFGRMEELMPEVSVNLEIFPEDGDTKIKTLAASGNLPDLYKTNSGLVQLFKNSNNVLPLNSYLQETGVLDRVRESELSRFFDDDGNCYAVPASVHEPYLIYYNKEVFADHGVEVPQNYDEFLAAVKTFVAGGEVVPLALFAKEPWPGTMFYEAIVTRYDGASLQLIDKGEASMADDPYVRAANQYKELIDYGLIAKSAFSATHEEALATFTNNKAAMFANGIWEMSTLYDVMGENVGYLDFPLQDETGSPDNHLIRVGGSSSNEGYAASPHSDHVDVVARYTCLMALEVSNGNYYNGYAMNTLSTDDITPIKELNPLAAQYAKESENYISYTVFPWNYSNPDTFVILGENVSKLMTGDYDVDKFISDTDTALKDVQGE